MNAQELAPLLAVAAVLLYALGAVSTGVLCMCIDKLEQTEHNGEPLLTLTWLGVLTLLWPVVAVLVVVAVTFDVLPVAGRKR